MHRHPQRPHWRAGHTGFVHYFDQPTPRVIAHRGESSTAPENTAAAFHAALEVGADVLETDIHVTADGHAVLWHDPVLIRWDDTPMAINSLTLAQLQSRSRGPHRILELGEALEQFPQTRFNIDVKTPAAIAATAAAIRDTRASERVLVTSFDQRTIDALRRLFPDAFFGTGQQAVRLAVMAVAARSSRLLRRALGGADAVQVPAAVRGLSLVSPRLLDAYLQHAREVHVWTVNDREQMQRLLAAGVSGLITDEPALARQLIDRGRDVTTVRKS